MLRSENEDVRVESASCVKLHTRVWLCVSCLLSPGLDADVHNGQALADVLDQEKKHVVKRLEKIERETAKKIESLELKSINILEVNPLADATLEQDPTTNWREAILDIYKRLRPGEAANEEAARQLIYGLFFDVKRYDLGKVGRRFLNQKLGVEIPLNVRNLTAEDLAAARTTLRALLQSLATSDRNVRPGIPATGAGLPVNDLGRRIEGNDQVDPADPALLHVGAKGGRLQVPGQICRYGRGLQPAQSIQDAEGPGGQRKVARGRGGRYQAGQHPRTQQPAAREHRHLQTA